MRTDAKMSGPRWRAILAAVSLVVLGGVLGVTLDRVWFLPALMDGDGPVDAQTEMVASLETELGLTPTQADEIAAILLQYQGHVTQTWEEMRPGLRAAMDSAGAEIEAVLAPDQRERFRTWIREQHGPNGSMGRGRIP